MATKKVELEFNLLPRLPFDRDGVDDEMARTGYLVINDLGSMHKMSWDHSNKKFFFADDRSIPVNMACVRAWVRLPVIRLPGVSLTPFCGEDSAERMVSNSDGLFVLTHAI